MSTREQAEAVRAFFAAMNAQDADAAAALVSDDVSIALGSHRVAGRSAVRELALQTDDQLTFETVPLELHAESDTVIAVRAQRTQRWRATGEIAAEETLHARFIFDGDGAISGIALG